MKSIFTLLASFIITLNSIAQLNYAELHNINISEISPRIKTSILGESSTGIVAYQTNKEENSISIGVLDSEDNFLSIKKEMLHDDSVENVFLRGSKVLVFTSNLNHLNGQEFKKNEVAPKVSVTLREVNLGTKKTKLSRNLAQYDYVNNATYYEGQLRIEESENEKFIGVCYGFVRGYSKPKKFKSYITLFNSNLEALNNITWQSDRALQEAKRYEQIIVSNTGEIYIMTLSNFSKKMNAIYPIYTEIVMKNRTYENELPGLTKSDTRRQFHSSNHVSINIVDEDSKTPKTYDIDFEKKLQYVAYNGCKMKLDADGNLVLAGLFSDAFNNFNSKGIFIAKINSSSNQMEIVYQEYFTEQFVDEILPNEKLKESAKTKFQKGKNPHINNVSITNIIAHKNDEFSVLMEYENYDIGNTKFADFDKKNKSYTGNLQLLKFTESGSKLDWSLPFTKMYYLYMPKEVIGSNRSYIQYFPSSNSLVLMYNEQNSNQTPKPSSLLGIEIDYPKLVMYEISNSGELSEKQELLNNTDNIIKPEKSIKVGNRFILQGTHKDIQKFFELK
ncbi:MAG: hypothetical protein ACI9GM_000851 [Salibacteraceae bacterium]|jgi:hypothetical protein